MQSVLTTRNPTLTNWQTLVDEIKEIEELIADVNMPHDTQAIWSLHLLQSQLRLKRQMLKDVVGRSTQRCKQTVSN